jgi:hypothetical protein
VIAIERLTAWMDENGLLGKGAPIEHEKRAPVWKGR